MKIYDRKSRRKTNNSDGSHLFEKYIDIGCFQPEKWDKMIRTYIKKRSTP
jgi:hypothetical protein